MTDHRTDTTTDEATAAAAADTSERSADGAGDGTAKVTGRSELPTGVERPKDVAMATSSGRSTSPDASADTAVNAGDAHAQADGPAQASGSDGDGDAHAQADGDAHARAATQERPPGYVAKCSMRGSSSSQADDDGPPIERAIRRPEGDAQALARNTAPTVDVPHKPTDRGTAEPKRRKPRDRPLTIVVTGDGKGKSTSAFGMLLRSWNRDYRCGVVQFVKSGKWKVGEQRAAEALGDIDWFKMGDGWSWISRDITESAKLAQAGWEKVREWIEEERYEFLLLDEFTYPLKWGWVDTQEVVDVLTNRTGFQHIVITGRDAPQALIDAADLVSEVTLVKHQMEQGIRGQQGIEW